MRASLLCQNATCARAQQCWYFKQLNIFWPYNRIRNGLKWWKKNLFFLFRLSLCNGNRPLKNRCDCIQIHTFYRVNRLNFGIVIHGIVFLYALLKIQFQWFRWFLKFIFTAKFMQNDAIHLIIPLTNITTNQIRMVDFVRNGLKGWCQSRNHWICLEFIHETNP